MFKAFNLLASFCWVVFAVFIFLRQLTFDWLIIASFWILNLSLASFIFAKYLSVAFAWSALNWFIAAIRLALAFWTCTSNSAKNWSICDWDFALNCLEAFSCAWSLNNFWNCNCKSIVFNCCWFFKLVKSVFKNIWELFTAACIRLLRFCLSIAANVIAFCKAEAWRLFKFCSWIVA